MSDVKISQLIAAQSVDDANVLPMVSGNATVKVSVSQLKEHAVGDTDISAVGDGTPTGAIATLNRDKLSKNIRFEGEKAIFSAN